MGVTVNDEDVEFWNTEAATFDTARRAVADPDMWAQDHGRQVAMVSRELFHLHDRPFAFELGCGVGRLAIPVARQNQRATVIGIDLSPAMVDHANREAFGVGNVVFVDGNGRTLPLMDGVAHAGWSMLCFQHLTGDVVAGYLLEVGRVLAPGARFVFQYVDGIVHGRHTHDHRLPDVEDWVEAARLVLLAVEVDALHSEWRWVTVEAQDKEHR